MILLLFCQLSLYQEFQYDLGSSRKLQFLILIFHDVFVKCFEFVGVWMKYALRPFELKVTQKKITNLSCELQMSTKSKAKSIAFASVVNRNTHLLAVVFRQNWTTNSIRIY